ncbi:cytochrome P450 [Mycena leptocephala]|nr:cytochrome P450 [Mycena leptocephala]
MISQFLLLIFLYYDLTSPLWGMVGPKSTSLVLGNFKQMAYHQDDALVRELHTSDTTAIGHIISRSVVYQKPPINRYSIIRFLGNGMRFLHNKKHPDNPAFGVAQIRQMSGIFIEKAAKLRDIWDATISDDNHPTTIEILSWLRRMTLDVIGEAGFNYQFHGLDGRPNDLNEVFTQLFHSPTSQRDGAFRLVQAMVPILRLIPAPGDRLFHTARSKMFHVGQELVEQTKLAFLNETADEPLSGRRRDLFIPENQRLSDEEVIGQIPTFFIAGHETTSSAIAEAQTRLREELLTVSSGSPTMDELNNLVYLEWVVRETMRVHSPVVFTTRMAMQDDTLPFAKTEEFTTTFRKGLIRKGQMIHIPILADAAEFKPERWKHVPKGAIDIPGVWANLLTFFAGPHNCIGFRFSLVEQKALLFTLIRAFEFENAVPGRSSNPLQRPVVLAEGSKTSQMPLIVKQYRRS